MSSERDFVHLHVHTEYSLLDGLSRIGGLVRRASELGMRALAISDHGTMYGVIDFYRACKAAGIKPIIGMETYVTPWGRRHTERDPQYDSKPYHMLLLAKDATGYKNLLKIASEAQLSGYYYRPRVDHDYLAAHAQGLIATSGCLAAEIPRLVGEGRDDVALERMGWYQEMFGPENFFLELQHHQIDELHFLNRWLLAHQGYTRAPLVATNDVHYVLEEDFDAHDTLLCVQTGSVKNERNRMRFSGPTFHLRTPEEMWGLFGEVPDALENTLRIAEMCDLDLDQKGYHLPVFPVPEGYDAASYLRHLCERGLRWRYGDHADDPLLSERLDYELSTIHTMGFDTYFLIVWDLCEFARHADIWWNVRGSGAGSVAAYSLGITNIDPLQNSLLFERFLNPGRVSMPDIDLDYPEDRRAEMIEYCAQKYGEDKVAAIITFGTMGSKAAIRDVGRALDMPLTEVDRIARLIPSGAKPVKFDDALGDDPEKALPELKQIYEEDDDARKLIEAARALEGITRHASTHAAGVIVADKPLVEYIPLHRPTKGSAEDAPVKMVTQFPMETCESIGLLKVDFLGLSTLTIMRLACDLIAQYHGIRYDLSNIPYRPDPDDPEQSRMIAEMFEMLGRGETIGVFQLESQGMRRMLTDMRPQRFEHIVAGIALYRPGPMEYIGRYNRRLHGEERPDYKHPALEPILEETYGIIVYQEQIMQIGAELFGYSLGEADLMRRAVSKKKKEALQEHRDIFMERGPEHGVPKEAASAIFDDIEYFARYGFNKCVTGDTEIVDSANGRLVRVGDLASGAATVEHTVTCDTRRLRLQPGPVTQVVANGVKPVYRLTTQLGRQITATANHPFYTFDGWRQLGELAPGVQIAVPRRIPVQGRRLWPEHQVGRLIETLCEDGSDVSLPGEVFELVPAQLEEIVARLWPMRSTADSRTFSTSSERLARQLQHLLLRLGTLAWLTQSEDGRTYTVAVDESNGQPGLGQVTAAQMAVAAPPLHYMERGLGCEAWGAAPAAEGDIYWDKIVAIEPAGEAMTYDLTVPDTHNFIANDLLVHNSHAADYGVLTCQTAFLKCHYPHEYMAALMSVQRDDSSKVGLFAADCHRMGIDVLPPTVNHSELDFSIEQQEDGRRAIRFGLGAIKNVGVVPLEHIVQARSEDGPFRDLDDFCRRVDARIVNKRALESLIKVGALDEFATRPALLAALDRIVSFSADHHKAKDTGQMSLFGAATGVTFGAEQSILANLHDVESISKREMLNWEKELVGLYVTDHPLRPLTEQLSNGNFTPTAELIEAGEAVNGRPVTVAGLVTSLRTIITKRGDTMAVLTLEDITGTISVVLFPRTWGEYRDMVEQDAVLIVRGKADTARGDVQVIADSVTQNFEVIAPVEQTPSAADLQLSWVADDEPPDPGEDPDDEAGAAADTPPVPPVGLEPPRQATSNGSGNGRGKPVRQTSAGSTSEEAPPPWLDEGMDWAPSPDWEPARPAAAAPPPPTPSATAPTEPALAPPPEASPEPPAAPIIPQPRRRGPQPPRPTPRAQGPSRMLTVTIPRGADAARDRKRIQRLHGYLTQYPGRDRFRFILLAPDGARTCLNFPKHPIEINDEVLDYLAKQVSDGQVEVEEG